MKLVKDGDVEPRPVDADKQGNPAKGTCIQVLLGGPNFVMRQFTLEPGGHTPRHSHPWEHEVFVVAGSGTTRGELEAEFSAGDALLVPAGETHSFENTGAEPLRMICVVPTDAG